MATHKYTDIIAKKEIDVTQLTPKTQRYIAKYEKLSAESEPNQEELDDLNEDIVNGIIDYLAKIETPKPPVPTPKPPVPTPKPPVPTPDPPKKKRGFFDSMHEAMYGKKSE